MSISRAARPGTSSAARRLIHSLIDQSIGSVGGGVRLSLPYNSSLGLEVAQTLHAVAGSDAGKEATKFFVTAGVRF